MAKKLGELTALLGGCVLTIALAYATGVAPTIPRIVAEKTALARVPGGRVLEGELEMEQGRRIWSFDISQPGTRNVVEVQVDAIEGTVISVKTETPKDEAREKARESKPKA